MLHDFECLRCGGKSLNYHKWVYCTDPLEISPNGHIEYGPPQVEYETTLGPACCYVCRDCKTPPSIYGKDLYCEADLREYLRLTLEERKDLEQKYLAQLAEQAEMEKLREYSDEPNFVEEELQAEEVQK